MSDDAQYQADEDNPQAIAEAALGAEILADAMETNGIRSMGDLLARPDAQRLVGEARERVAGRQEGERP